MCLFNFCIFFKINYRCNHGESLYITGNTSALGNWDPSHALRLSWKEGHNWEIQFKLKHDNTKLFEYKFFVAPTNNPCNCNIVRWESGPNH
mmetsp:Transcript_15602/g.13335  ORF Transcript_15602/g.13335 Transcript_15602/m.13335 type:complete len:91 (-) Transcript_15602:1215-1487(-)